MKLTERARDYVHSRRNRGYNTLVDEFAEDPFKNVPVHSDPEVLTIRNADDFEKATVSLNGIESDYRASLRWKRVREAVFSASGVGAVVGSYLALRHGMTDVWQPMGLVASGAIMTRTASAIPEAHELKQVIRATNEVEDRLRWVAQSTSVSEGQKRETKTVSIFPPKKGLFRRK